MSQQFFSRALVSASTLLLMPGCVTTRVVATHPLPPSSTTTEETRIAASSNPPPQVQTAKKTASNPQSTVAGSGTLADSASKPGSPARRQIDAQSGSDAADAGIRLTAAEESGSSSRPAAILPVPNAPVESSEIAAAPVPPPAAGGWTLQQLEATALQYNPAIQQASASAGKATGFHEQVGLKPNPTIGYNGTQLADNGTDQHVAFVEQDVVMAKKLERNRAVLNQEIQSQLWEVEAQRYRVLTDVRQRYYEALAAQRRLALAVEFHEIATRGVEVAKARFDAKEGSRPELLQMEIQLNQVTVLRRQADAAFRGAWNQLMAVTGLGQVAPGTLDGELPASIEITDMQPIKEMALSASPELQAARSRVARARANIDRQEVQAIPNLQFMLAGGVDNGTNSQMLNAQVGLPVPLFNKNQGNIMAAHSEMTRACQDLRRIELAIESRMARAAQEYESAAAAVEQYQQMILPKAEETLKLTEDAYEAGEFGFLQILVARRTYFDANLEYVIAQADLAKAKAYLDGLALSGGLDNTRDVDFDSGLRDQSLSGQ